MSVSALRHDKQSRRFSKSRGLSASVSFLSSPPPPRLLTPFFARSLTLETARKRLLRRLARARHDEYCPITLSYCAEVRTVDSQSDLRISITFIPPGVSSRRKYRGGTLVTRAYIEESTYSWNIQSVYQKKTRFAWTGTAITWDQAQFLFRFVITFWRARRNFSVSR